MIKIQFLKPVMLLILSFIFLSVNQTMAQSYKINSKTSSMVIHGTTNVHNFDSKVDQISGELVLNSSKQVQSLKIQIPVKGIKSGEKLMDTKTYETFDSEKNPNITFQLVDATSVQISSEDVNAIVTGNLTMAGVTKKISFKATGKSVKPGVYEFKGSIVLKMTDFKMKPPTAMLGMMKVGDAVTLNYDINVEGSPIN